MAISKNDIRTSIREVLTYIGKHTSSAEEMLMLTCATESSMGTYLFQVKGPARGIFQMEPTTEHDCWVNYLNNLDTELPEKIKSLMYSGMDNLSYNIAYQIAMCRVKYLRVKESIPESTNYRGLAAYWKQYYNTPLGKGTVERAISDYQRLVLS